MSIFKDIYDILKDLIHLARESGNQTLADTVTDIQAKLFEFKEENENLKDKIKELQEQIKSYNIAIEFEKTMILYEQPCYSIKGDAANRFFCTNCWNLTKDKTQLINTFNGYFYCPKCKTQHARPASLFK